MAITQEEGIAYILRNYQIFKETFNMKKLTSKQEIENLNNENLRLRKIITEQTEQLQVAIKLFEEFLESYDE
tara:strand:- start:1305 stop:1520 length:216 start_codon:yes stop_codon:yes gene_type:complete